MRTHSLPCAALISAFAVAFIAHAQTPTTATPAATPAPPATPRPPPPTRPADGPLAPRWTVINGAGKNAPADQDGNFLIGPEYVPAPELTVVAGVPMGTIKQFVMKSEDSRIYPKAIAREVFGTPDPDNYKTLIVATHEKPWERAITVYIPATYNKKKPLPFIVAHDGPKMGEPDMTMPRILDNLIAQKRVPAMAVVMIQNGGGDAQGHQRGLEYDTLSGRFAAVRVRHAGGNLGRARLWPQQWLLIEWPAAEPEPTKYWLSTLPEETSLNDLVSIAHLRWRIERDYQELKQELGLGHYEGRGWRGFHHHATLTIAAYGFLMTEQLAARSNRGSKKNSIRSHLQRQAPALPADYVPRGSPARAKTHAQLDHDAALPDQR
jgi:hypothetical protein